MPLLLMIMKGFLFFVWEIFSLFIFSLNRIYGNKKACFKNYFLKSLGFIFFKTFVVSEWNLGFKTKCKQICWQWFGNKLDICSPLYVCQEVCSIRTRILASAEADILIITLESMEESCRYDQDSHKAHDISQRYDKYYLQVFQRIVLYLFQWRNQKIFLWGSKFF